MIARIVRGAPALLFAMGALFHAATLLDPTLGDPSPPWRHALFLAINATFAGLFWRKPRWLMLAYAPLAAQQCYSHGEDLVRSTAPWSEVQSLFALASIPWFLWVALGAWRAQRPL